VLTAAKRPVWLGVLAACGLLCVLETLVRLGGASPDTRFTLPQFSLGFFWGTPLGWTGLVDGVWVNRDSVQFASLAGFFRDAAHVPVPPQDNVYVRFAGYSLVGSALAPVLGDYAAFVVTNVVFWLAGVWATCVLGVRKTNSPLVGGLAAGLVATAPVFAALVGQALPYVASYGLFALGLLLLDQARAFESDRPLGTLALIGFGAGTSLLFYDLYMLPAFVVVYGLLQRRRLVSIVVLAAVMLLPRLVWTGYWQAMHLPSYAHNEQHPMEALLAWFDTARVGVGPLDKVKGYAFLAAHGLLNISSVFLFWPALLAVWELWQRRRSASATWFVAVLVAGFGPALFMLSTWPHIPRWYAYGYPAIYILAAAAAVRIASAVRGLSGRERVDPRERPGSLARDGVSKEQHAMDGLAHRELTRGERAQAASGAGGVAQTGLADGGHSRGSFAELGLVGVGIAVLVLVPGVVLSNLDVAGYTKPMELLLFQPSSWSYLWSR
jgi:hypothetical protein